MAKIIFCGNFNPIHNGHLNMAKIASEQLNSDVIFIPSKVAIWKNDSIAPIHKINMLTEAIKNEPRFSINLYEINNTQDKVFSIDTINYFINNFKDEKFYFLIGQDQVNHFHLWHKPDEIANKVQIIYFERPENIIENENIEKYHMQKVVGTLIDESSTAIRNFQSLNTPYSVIKYIEENNLYYVPKIKGYLDHKRYLHSVSVANLAYQIAVKHNKKQSYKYYMAGLLHDIGKNYASEIEIMDKYFKNYLDVGNFAYHQFVGSYLIKKDFSINDKNIIKAVEFHATGNSNMSDLAKVVYASDKIDPLRDYDSSELIKAMFDYNINKGFKIVLKANKDFLTSKNKNIYNKLTLKCFNQYLK